MALIVEKIQEIFKEGERDKDLEGPPVFDKELIIDNYGESLVMRCSLHTSIGEKKKRTMAKDNIFHTKCISQGKMCDTSLIVEAMRMLCQILWWRS